MENRKLVKFNFMLTPEEYEVFFEKALKIIDFETGKTVPLKLNPIQRRLLYQCEDRNQILKARRHGISTVILAMAFTNCLAFKNFKAAFIADKKDNAREIFETIHFFLNHLPKDLQVPTDTETKDEVSFSSMNSKITVSTAGAKTAKRGSGLNFIHFSEIAFFENVEIITAAREARMKELVTFYESTANGMNHFFDWWEDAKGFFKKPQTSTVKPFFFSWAEHPSYRKDVQEGFKLSQEEKHLVEEAAERDVSVSNENIMWMRWKLLDMDDPTLFPQEYPLFPRDAFISTGRPVFNLSQLDRMKQNSKDYRVGNLELNRKHNVQFFDEKGGYIRFFDEPELGKQYIIGADVAEGKQDGDFSAACVIDAETHVQVAEFHGHLDPDQYAYRLNQLGKFYNEAVLIVEQNGPGHSVNSMLYNHYNYSRLWQEEVDDSDGSISSSANLGFRTNKATREELLALSKRAIRLGLVKLNSVPCIMECCAFEISKTGKAEAAKNKHDDRVIAMMLAIYGINRMPELSTKFYPDESDSKYYNFISTQTEVVRRGKSGYGA